MLSLDEHRELLKEFLPARGLESHVQNGPTIHDFRELFMEFFPALQTQSSTNAWQIMAKTVRDFDEDKVRDCQDDMDTLLVFAGLYSAVLSAFLIETYSSLQPDNGTQMVFLLQQLVAQNYTINAPFVNSSSPHPMPPPFQPPSWAVRVNGLWFASLVFSLSAASFGMLVKQWLREYLASEYISPQERLRARQYRNPSLKSWRVFEIAAILPFLLQISLGLFFVGLCFFTAQVSISISRSTLILVAAWAFLFLSMTFAPLLSPRCPFKTPLLKNILRLGRRWITRPVSHLVVHTLPKIFSRPTASVNRRLNMPEEEDQVIRGAEGDIELLLSVDALIGDDALLETMGTTNIQARLDPEKIPALALELIKRRTAPGTVSSTDGLPGLLDLRSMSKRSYDAVMTIVADALATHHPGPSALDDTQPQWVWECIILLFSFSMHAPPEGAIRKLFVLLSDAQGCTCSTSAAVVKCLSLAACSVSSGQYLPIAPRLLQVAQVDRRQSCLTWGLKIYWIIISACWHTPLSGDLGDELRQSAELCTDARMQPILDDLWYYSCEGAHFEYSNAERIDAETFSDGASDAITLVLILAYMTGSQSKMEVALDIVAYMWSKLFSAIQIAWISAAVHPRRRVPDEFARVLLSKAFSRCDVFHQRVMVSKMTKMSRRFAGGAYATHITAIDFPRVCQQWLTTFQVQLEDPRHHAARSDHEIDPNISITPHDPAWNELWTAFAAAIQHYYFTRAWSGYYRTKGYPTPLSDRELIDIDYGLARECLKLIDDCHRTFSSLDASSDGTRTPAFPDELVRALGLFVSRGDRPDFPLLVAALENVPADDGSCEVGYSSGDAQSITGEIDGEDAVGGHDRDDHSGAHEEDDGNGNEGEAATGEVGRNGRAVASEESVPVTSQSTRSGGSAALGESGDRSDTDAADHHDNADDLGASSAASITSDSSQ